MITNYGTLKSTLQSVIGRPPSEVVYQLTTRDLNRDLRVREMEATQTVISAATVPLTGNIAAIKSVYRDSNPRTALRSVETNAIHTAFRSAGVPTLYAFVEGNLLLDAPGTDNLIVRTFNELAEFSSDNDTNNVLVKYPNTYFYGALAHHSRIIGDSRFTVWQGSYESAITQANKSNARQAMPAVVPRTATP